MCKQFAIGECEKGDDCQMLHQFCTDSSLKRTYYKTVSY